MNGRQRLIEQIRQQSIEKRAQALREAARNQANNAPIAAAGASSSGGGRRAEVQCLPLGGVMLSFLNPFTEAYVRYFLTESGTLNGQPQYLALMLSGTSKKGDTQEFLRIRWNGSEWVLSQVFIQYSYFDENDFAFSPTLFSSAWQSEEDSVELTTSRGEEFDCSWRYCFVISGVGESPFTYNFIPAWIDVALTEAPDAYIAGSALIAQEISIIWDTTDLTWFVPGDEEIFPLPGGTREQLPIGSFTIYDDRTLTISSGICSFTPPPLPPQ
jgi:hypothetical protein